MSLATNLPSRILIHLLLAGAVLAPAAAQGTAPTSRSRALSLPGGQIDQREVDFGAPGAGSESLEFGGVLWTVASDGSWIADNVALGSWGTQVATLRGAFSLTSELYSAHDADPPAAIWQDVQSTIAFAQRVDSADRADVHVALHQEYADAQQSFRRAVLRKYTSFSGQPDWTYVSPILLGAGQRTDVHVSADGGTIVLLEPDTGVLNTRASVFGPDSAVPLVQLTLDTFGAFERSALSTDGTTLALIGLYKLLVVDLPTQQVTRSELLLGTPQYGGLALSGDGSLVATATLGSVRVLERDGQGAYQTAFTLDLGPNDYGRRLAFSEDGSTLVVGAHTAGEWDSARLLSIDVPTQTVLFDVALAGGGEHQFLFSEIECSADGRRIAAGTWGDADPAAPELLVFRRDSPIPLLVHQTPGSVLDLDLDPTGDRVAIASKGVHANVWGGGGRIELIEIPTVDLSVAGVPRPGTTVTVEHRARSGDDAQVLVSDALLEAPIEDPSLGEGVLWLDPAGLVTLPAVVAGPDDVARTAFAIDGARAVGDTLYLQAVDLSTGRLSRDWVALTLLP